MLLKEIALLSALREDVVHGVMLLFVRKMVPRGLEPRTLRLLAVRSNQLSYETLDAMFGRASSHGQGGCGSGMQCSICQVHAS